MATDRALASIALKQQTMEDLRKAGSNFELVRNAVDRYLTHGMAVGLTYEELTDYFCVSTPNIVEGAGFSGPAFFSIVEVFDIALNSFSSHRDRSLKAK